MKQSTKRKIVIAITMAGVGGLAGLSNLPLAWMLVVGVVGYVGACALAIEMYPDATED